MGPTISTAMLAMSMSGGPPRDNQYSNDCNVNVWRSTRRTMNARDGQWSPVEATWMERVDKHENIFI